MPHNNLTILARCFAMTVALLSVIGGGVASHITGGWALSVPVLVALLAAIWIMASWFKPAWVGRTKTRLAILAIFSMLAASTSLFGELLLPLVSQIYTYFGFSTPTIGYAQLWIIVTLVLILLAITFLFERRPITAPLPTSSAVKEDVPFDTKDYKIVRESYCKFMISELNRINQDTNWSDTYFTNLEAEIEVENNSTGRPHTVSDLVAAIRNDRSTSSFLLIGEPGSGKSVSLRKLALELYESIDRTDIVPIYINLKEWEGPSPQTDDDLRVFIRRYLLDVSGRAGKAFIEKWFDPMLEHGGFFFLLDSFDEMPAILDCDDRSTELAAISKAFDMFLQDIHGCRCVISSRPFRQPVNLRCRRMTIRPFNEQQIRNAMRLWLRGYSVDADVVLRRLLAKNPELAGSLRNPFLADLTAQYIISHPDQVPEALITLYESYVSHRLYEHKDDLQRLDVSVEEVEQAAIAIAEYLYSNSQYGLEIDLSDLEASVNIPKLRPSIDALVMARLARRGGRRQSRFSFVHRRFAEFFVAQALQQGTLPVDASAIPTDSRWRDCLVLYCGVASPGSIDELVRYAAENVIAKEDELIDGNVTGSRSAIHCLRFLRDTCSSRVDLLGKYRNEISYLVARCICHGGTLTAKIAGECAVFVDSNKQSDVVMQAMNRRINWVTYAILRSLRHHQGLDSKTVTATRHFIATLPSDELLRSFLDLNFSLSLSPSFARVRRWLWIDVIHLFVLWFVSIPYLLLLLIYWSGVIVAISFCIMLFLCTTFVDGVMYPRLKTNYNPNKKERDFSTRPYTSLLFVMNSWYRPGFDTCVCLYLFCMGVTLLTFPDLRIHHIDKEPWVTSCLLIAMAGIIPLEPIARVLWLLRPVATNFRQRLKRVLILCLSIAITVGVFAIVTTIIFFLAWPEWVNVLVTSVVMIIGVAGCTFLIFSLFRTLYHLDKDRRSLCTFQYLGAIEWPTIRHNIEAMKTDWGQARYLERLRISRIEIREMPDSPKEIKLKGIRSEEQFARLLEQSYDLLA